MDCRKTLVVCVYLTCMLYGVCCQSSTPRPIQRPSPKPNVTTIAPNVTANVTNREYGIIVTLHAKEASRFAAIRHLPVMPYYQNYSGQVPGVGFTNRYIQFLSVDIDYRLKKAYLYDVHLRAIAVCHNYHRDLRPQDVEFQFMHIGVSSGTIQVAVDWVTHTVYWTDGLFRWVIGASGLRKKIDLDYYKIIMDTHLTAPEGIGVDPLTGQMFVLDGGPSPKIERASMIGAKRQTIVSSGMKKPRALEVDVFGRRVYWIDEAHQTIQSCNYDGFDRQRTKLMDGTSLFDLAIYRDILAVTDIETGNMYFMNKTTGNKRATTINFLPEVMYGVAIYHIDNQPMPDPGDQDGPCDELGCEQMCMLDGTKATCFCSEGFKYDERNKTCVEAMYKRGLVIANSTHICIMDIRHLAHTSYSEKCVFTVVKPPHVTVAPTQPPTTTGPPTTILPTTPRPSQVNRTSTARPVTNSPLSTRKPQTTTRRPTTTPRPKPRAAPGEEIKLFDIHAEDRMLYYADGNNNIWARSLDMPLENLQKQLIVSADAPITGLVVDWLGGQNIYWCEATTGKFYVVNDGNGAPRMVSNTNALKGARDLVLLPQERALAWIQDFTEIHKMNLDGSNHVVLKSDLKGAKYLTYEYHEKLLYYMDTNEDIIYTLSVSDLDQHQFSHYAQTNSSHLTIYKDYIMWAYTFSDNTYMVTYQRTGTIKRIASGYVENFGELVQMKILDETTQPKVTDACRYENGNCEQICITHMEDDKPIKKCLCSLGFTPGADGTSCESQLSSTDDAIYVSDATNNAIYQINLRTDQIQSFDPDSQGSFLAVLYNPLDNMLYYGKDYTDMMLKSPLDGSNVTTHLDLVWADVESMQLDEHSGNIYFTGNLFSYIGVVTPQGHEVELRDMGFDILGAIAIHPGKGWLYWVVIDSFDHPYIGRSNMDGSGATELLKPKDTLATDTKGNLIEMMQKPYGLAIDYEAGNLYWSDTVTSVIQKCDLDAKNCTRFVRDYDANITDIKTDGDFLYYVGLNRHYVTAVKLDDTSDTKKFGKHVELGKLTHMSVYRKNNMNVQPVSSGCKDNEGLGDCSTVCLPTALSRTCGCDYGTELKPDGKTCEDIYQCKPTFNQAHDDTEIKIISTCKRYPGDKCEYKCEEGWVPADKSNTTLECGSDGWDREADHLCIEIRCPEKLLNGKWTNCERNNGDKCGYTCNPGFQPTKNTATCTNDGTWDEDTTTLCSAQQCSATIPNGYLDLNKCDPRPGKAPCDYMCTNGTFKKNKDIPKITCNADFKWNVDTNKLCIELGCPKTIRNGQLEGNCNNLLPGSKCSYSCNTGFNKPPGVSQVTCLRSEAWDAHGYSPCIGVCTNSQFTCKTDGSCIDATKKCDKKSDCSDGSDESLSTCPPLCPATYPNGQLSMNCAKTVGSTCVLTCSMGFTSSGIQSVACSSNKKWQPTNVCKPILCPSLIPMGELTGNCGRGVNSLCTFNCPENYEKTAPISSLKCLPTGQWNQTDSLCKVVRINVSPEEQKGEKGGSQIGTGVGIGVGVLLLILIILALVAFLIYRRRKAYKETPYAMSFDSGGSNVAIENPGYMPSQDMSKIDTDTGYSTLNAEQMQPTRFAGDDSVPVDHEMVNPMYMEKHAEALPEVSHVDLHPTSENPSVNYMDWKSQNA